MQYRQCQIVYYIYVRSFCGFTIDSYIIEICNLIIFLFFHLFTHRFVRFGCSIGNVKSYIKMKKFCYHFVKGTTTKCFAKLLLWCGKDQECRHMPKTKFDKASCNFVNF